MVSMKEFLNVLYQYKMQFLKPVCLKQENE
jgi:hypothetical protein